MKKLFLLSTISLFLLSCDNQEVYENKEFYEIQIGESVEIYYATNSCCYFCCANRSDLTHVSFLEEKTVDSGPSDCDGCAFTGAFVFVGQTEGIDTVKLISRTANQDCDSITEPTENFIIKVIE